MAAADVPKARTTVSPTAAPDVAAARKSKSDKIMGDAARITKVLHDMSVQYQLGCMQGMEDGQLAALRVFIMQTSAAAASARHLVADLDMSAAH